MKKENLLKKLKELEDAGGNGVQEIFDKGNSGSCPCFDGRFIVDGKKCEVWGRCWRVSNNIQDLHILAPKEIREAIKRCLDAQEWYNPYTIIEHRKTFL